MAGLVIADASPLIALARVNGLTWLADLFAVVRVPAPVAAEVLTGGFPATEAAIHNSIAKGRLVVVTAIPPEPELPDLDEGEAACLRLALASPEPSLVLIDERPGRAVALELGLQVAGTAAVIGMARRRGLIPSARQAFHDLHASDFRIAPAVIQAVLERCGEQDPG